MTSAASAGTPASPPGRLPAPRDVPRPWLDAYPPGVPPRYAYPEVALTRLLDDAARDFPTSEALVSGRTSLTYAQLRDLVDRGAAALRGLGLQPGDVAAVVAPNGVGVPILAFSAWRVGASLLPVHPRHGGPEIVRRLAQTDAVVAVAAPELVDELADAQEALPRLRGLATLTQDGWDDDIRARLRRRRQRQRADQQVPVVHELLASHAPVAPSPVTPADIAIVAYTSGTTAPPRPVRLSHANVLASAFQSRLWVPDVHAGKERMVVATDLAGLLGLSVTMLSGVLAAATLVIPRSSDVGEVARAIEGEGATLLHATPSTYTDLAADDRAAKRDLTSLRACLSVGAPLSDSVVRAFEAATDGGRLREAYGLTEAGGITHANPIYGRVWSSSIGLPVTDTVALIVAPDDHQRVLPAGEVGHIAVAGPQVGLGGTAARVGEWLITPDLGTMRPDGSFTYVGRADRVPDEHEEA